MSYERLLRLNKTYFTHHDVARALGIKSSSAEVWCSRYMQKGLLTRLKRGLYTKTESLAHMSQIDLFRIANILQVPSYISLMTALSYYGITTQLQRDFFESISVKRTKSFQAANLSFKYMRIKPDLYGGFVKKEGFFVALPEKAILDCFYFASMGRYPLDIYSLDLTKTDDKSLAKLTKMYPQKTIDFFERHYAAIRKA
jgi:predicted transcriptional regulator of viral defense system